MTFPAFSSERSVLREAAALIESLEDTWQCRITIHDQLGRLSHQNRSLLSLRHHIHSHDFCQWKRRSEPGWNTACNQHCLYDMGRRVLQGEGQHFCWKGATEVICPIIIEEAHVLTMFAGVFQGKQPADLSHHPRWRTRWERLPKITTEQAERLGMQLHMLGHHLCMLVQPPSYQAASRKQRIEWILATRAHESLTLADLAADLSLSQGQCSREVKRLLGRPFQNLLQSERLNRAAILLKNSDLTVGEVALRVGFSDSYHFNRVFRNHFGSPPGKWRQME